MNKLKVLIACEESQTVCKEFRKLGHEAYSCDLIDCSGGHPEWHIKQDVIPLLNGKCSFYTCDGIQHKINKKWDLIIAHPPCTHIASTGQWAYKKNKPISLREDGVNFFMEFVKADCDKIAIENPVGIMSTRYQKPTQIIHPWQFGDEAEKTTCLWLKGLPKLEPTKIVGKGETFDYVNPKTGGIKHYPKWMMDALKAKTPEERSRLRSKTFPGIAKAMATQFIEYLQEEDEIYE